jgi:hypothetical protein
MRLDLYTKAVLTVIACCLLYLCFVSRPQIVRAEGQEHVLIDGVSQGAYLPVIIAGVSEDSFHPFEVPVTIRSASQNVPVSVMNVGGQGVSPGEIPVAQTS